MLDFPALLQNGHAWLFIPSAVLLGALHGLEPGHSKTMMAALIVAVRGTVTQAVYLGLAATLSHTAVVWALALLGLYLGARWDVSSSEPYFQLASAVLMVVIAAWMLLRTWRIQHHDAHHSHSVHAHQPTALASSSSHKHSQASQPHAHTAAHIDAHAKVHAHDIEARFVGKSVTTGQIIGFGLTGGLIPCPASITVLLLCLQLKKFTLGLSLVLSFSVGLALTMTAAGVIAAWGLRRVTARWSGLDAFAKRAPYVSGFLILSMGVFFGYAAWQHLPPFALH